MIYWDNLSFEFSLIYTHILEILSNPDSVKPSENFFFILTVSLRLLRFHIIHCLSDHIHNFFLCPLKSIFITDSDWKVWGVNLWTLRYCAEQGREVNALQSRMPYTFYTISVSAEGTYKTGVANSCSFDLCLVVSTLSSYMWLKGYLCLLDTNKILRTASR